MCDVATAVMIGSAAFGAYGQMQQADYHSQVAKNNAIIADQQATDALKRGEEDERQHRLRVEALKGEQRSALAANGVILDDGSALDILADTAEQGELDALTIRNNAEREAYGHRVQAGNFRSEASAAKSSGYMSAGSTLLSGASSVSSKWKPGGSGGIWNNRAANGMGKINQGGGIGL